MISIEGSLEADALAAALGRVVERHEILRTTFAHSPGIRIPLQVVADELPPAFEVRRLGGREELESVLAGERSVPLDFENGPLVRCLLLTGGARHLAVLTVSSLCADVSSMPVIAGELAHELGADVSPTEDPLQYADFAAWQAELSEADTEEAGGAREAWSALAQARSPELPFTRSGQDSSTFEEVSIELPAGASQALVHAAWHALLARLSGEQRVVVSYLSPDRRHADLEGAIGAFARPVPIAVDVEGDATFTALVGRIENARRRALELHDYCPSDRPEAEIGYLEYEGLGLERVVARPAGWNLWLSCKRGEAAWIGFDPARHDRESVERLARELQTLIAGAVADLEAPVAALDLLDDDERAQIVERFGRGPALVDAAPRVVELIARSAAAAPDAPAVLDGEHSLNYGELDARANQLARHLREAGAGPGAPVGLCMDRSTAMIVGLVGILKSGAAYIPLNYEHPAARLAQQLATAGARAIVTQESLLDRLPELDAEIVCLDRDRAKLDALPAAAPEVEISDDELAYVIYTSGSTGQPKGVAVTHGNLANYVADIRSRLGADEERLSFGAVTAISTDLGNTSVFGALGSGGTLVLVSPERAADAAAFAAQLDQTPVDILKITPSHLGALLAAADPRVLPRRTLVLGGERAPWDLIDRVGALSGCSILNHYGPTEATVGCCTFPVPDGPGPHAPATVPIGRPIAGTTCYVLDSEMQPMPIGVAGTLYIGGAGVARGYVGQPELTAELFVDDPFEPGERLYNTGDVVRWLPDGALEFLGRVDEQVKIRGYRVEPAEVEAVLRRDPRVAEVAVGTADGPGGERRLVAYYAAREQVSADELRAALAEQLPEFMIPSAIVRLDEMPRTPSGKIDRLALPEPETAVSSAASEYTPPSSPTEEAIAATFAHTLGIERVGRDADFFELGGHSLLATQVVAQIRSELAVDLPLHALFTSPTVALLAAEVVALMGASDADETSELLAELESLSDEEVQELLAGEAADGERR